MLILHSVPSSRHFAHRLARLSSRRMGWFAIAKWNRVHRGGVLLWITRRCRDQQQPESGASMLLLRAQPAGPRCRQRPQRHSRRRSADRSDRTICSIHDPHRSLAHSRHCRESRPRPATEWAAAGAANLAVDLRLPLVERGLGIANPPGPFMPVVRRVGAGVRRCRIDFISV